LFKTKKIAAKIVDCNHFTNPYQTILPVFIEIKNYPTIWFNAAYGNFRSLVAA
jgi:hypothetical protein